MTPSPALLDDLRRELDRPLPSAVSALATQLAARGGDSSLAILFYGSTLRSGDLDGLLDFYVLLEHFDTWHSSRVAARANAWLPPNVSFEKISIDGRELSAKVAVLTLDQFRRGMRCKALDTTLWARFAQPCALAWSRDPASQRACLQSIAAAVCTAADWAAKLGPAQGQAEDFWTALFRRTYAAELRVESGSGRALSLVDADRSRYQRLLPLAWQAQGIDYAEDQGLLQPVLTAAAKKHAERAWSWRRQLGKPLNLARLAKATFTFNNAADYAAWKVERHAGIKLELSDWQRRHPLLAAPGVFWQLRKKKVLR